MKKILIIDDNDHNRLLVKMILEKKGYTVLEAGSGHAGVSIAKEKKPNLIILDIMMPELDGWEVIRILKQSRETDKIPVVVFTALDNIEEDIEEVEADGFLQKPLDINQLFKTVAEVIG